MYLWRSIRCGVLEVVTGDPFHFHIILKFNFEIGILYPDFTFWACKISC